MEASKKISSIFILLEVLIGSLGGILYINSLGPPESSLMDSIFNFYVILNGIFFGVTLVLGSFSAIYLKKTDRLMIAILFSLAYGFGFLMLHAFVLSIPLMAFLSLFGFILGFNTYLFKESTIHNGS